VDRSVEQVIDEILVMDCQSGSARAMEMLVGRWQKRLWKYAYNVTNDAEAAWEITQESWLGIIKGLRKLQDPANFKAWAYRITTNKSIDWIKKKSAARKVGLDDVQNHQHKNENDAGLEEMLEKLDIKKRAVLNLYYFDQLSVPEISIALKIPKGTVKSRLFNARRELKELYQKHIE
jgi:RNA polymerase sigma factor (sigma-70 family)